MVLAQLLLKHSKKSGAPLRLTVDKDESGDSDGEATYTHKYRKVSIRIWQDIDKTHLLWHELVQQVTCLEHLALCLEMYEAVLENYMRKKLQKQKVEKLKAMKKKEEPRRSLRHERRKKKIEDEHDDDCYFCDDGGELICCETCTTVVHPKCIGLKEIPEEDWFCDNCKKESEGRRMTRSKTLTRRLLK